ncbi:DNA-directed RNA polymerase subunit N (RpoN/RPB10) [Salirhabdus euzebyi]|uniref:DNA-directed RNA polymerase subunit N (RpoN/RPB10) n=1 Tax=Salirhabdus euzebyi TaxID=394506 RepID=A0A841PW03_9BACI|nr:abortive infection system antitoxin AbiGi family protein [Salirhabdus euzebyi]MBB6451954.1 DNA-directed RNA polymerase subunit N (RpoN/RPB10) [Salirhabdus euzebyi]
MKPRFYSNVYWHFTGGPVSKDGSIVWHHYRCLREVKKNSVLRDPKEAMENLKNIINTRVLKATTTEKILDKVETEKFCCVCDIPLKDLTFHRQYYGDYAVGFNSIKIHKNFHPVLYFEPLPTKIIKSNKLLHSKETEVLDMLGINNHNPLINFLKITHFDVDYDDTFYGEREWRCLNHFYFDKEDVEAVIVPKNEVNIINNYLNHMGYNNISVLSWDLIENI